MTKHPLTEEMMEKIHDDEPGNFYPYDEGDMRAAYDKGREEGHAEMLEAISRWTKKHAWSYMEECRYTDDHEFNASKFVAHLRKAMHPMEDN